MDECYLVGNEIDSLVCEAFEIQLNSMLFPLKCLFRENFLEIPFMISSTKIHGKTLDSDHSY